MTDAEALIWARRYATYALLERLTPGNPNNDKVRQRVAGIRAGNLDTSPEVRAVFLFITENRKAAALCAESVEAWIDSADLVGLKRIAERIQGRVAGVAEELEGATTQ